MPPLFRTNALIVALLAAAHVSAGPCSPGQYMLPSGTPAAVTYSSSWSSVSGTTGCNNPLVSGGGAWCAATSSGSSDWLQVDLGVLQFVAQVTTYGKAGAGQWVSAYNLQASTTGTTWVSVGQFVGNTDATTGVTNYPSVVARYLRFYPITVSGWASMRVAVNIYPTITCTNCPVGTFSASGAMPQCIGCVAGTVTASLGSAVCASLASYPCEKAVSTIATLSPSSTGLTYYASSWLAGASCQAPTLTNLTTAVSWCAGTNTVNSEYLILDAGAQTTVLAVLTRGRPTTNQWVTAYKVFLSNDTVTWTAPGTYDSHGTFIPISVFSANTNAASTVTQSLGGAYTARYVKLVVAGFQGAIAMSAGLVLGAPLNSAISTCPGVPVVSSSLYPPVTSLMTTVTCMLTGGVAGYSTCQGTTGSCCGASAAGTNM